MREKHNAGSRTRVPSEGNEEEEWWKASLLPRGCGLGRENEASGLQKLILGETI